jgi:hypothetical protein
VFGLVFATLVWFLVSWKQQQQQQEKEFPDSSGKEVPDSSGKPSFEPFA